MVDRPPDEARSKYPVAALLGTLGTRRAVRISFKGHEPERVIMALHKAASRRGVRLRYRRDRRALIAWVERRQEKSA